MGSQKTWHRDWLNAEIGVLGIQHGSFKRKCLDHKYHSHEIFLMNAVFVSFWEISENENWSDVRERTGEKRDGLEKLVANSLTDDTK